MKADLCGNWVDVIAVAPKVAYIIPPAPKVAYITHPARLLTNKYSFFKEKELINHADMGQCDLVANKGLLCQIHISVTSLARSPFVCWWSQINTKDIQGK